MKMINVIVDKQLLILFSCGCYRCGFVMRTSMYQCFRYIWAIPIANNEFSIDDWCVFEYLIP
jgi:hypothetical protein